MGEHFTDRGDGRDLVTKHYLRAELATLELRVLAMLATKTQVEKLDDRLDDVAAAALTPDAVREMISKALREAEARGWTSRERGMAIVLFLVTLGTFTLQVWAATR